MKRTWSTAGFATLLALLAMVFAGSPASGADKEWIVFDGHDGPGKGKHIVLLCGDEEYRSEELIPQLAKILSVHQGFKCTVLFSINKESGEVDPQTLDNVPGLTALKDADMMIVFFRFRELPDDQMKHFIDFTNSGKPMMGLRTSTHAFNYRKNRSSPYAWTSFRSKEPKGGWGRAVLGETWISHFGAHQRESTRGLIAKGMEKSPIVKGCEDIWGPSDVYGLTTLEGECEPVIMGQVLEGMDPKDKPNEKKELVPVAWTKTYKGKKGKTSRVFSTTMGHGGDLQSEGFRRLLVNACFWALEMEDKIPARAKVDLVGPYKPNHIGIAKQKMGLKPADYAIK